MASVVLNGHTYDSSQFTNYGYLQTLYGDTLFPNAIFTDMLAQLASATSVQGVSPDTAGNLLISTGTVWTTTSAASTTRALLPAGAAIGSPASTTGAATGDSVYANAKAIRFANAAGSTTLRALLVDASNILQLGQDVASVTLAVGTTITGSATASVFRISSGAGGGYGMATVATQFRMSAGAEYTASAWTARATEATIWGADDGDFFVYVNTGLTSGNAFTPTRRLLLDTTSLTLTVNDLTQNASNGNDSILHLNSATTNGTAGRVYLTGYSTGASNTLGSISVYNANGGSVQQAGIIFRSASSGSASGQIDFYTKANAGILTLAMVLGSTQDATFSNNILQPTGKFLGIGATAVLSAVGSAVTIIDAARAYLELGRATSSTSADLGLIDFYNGATLVARIESVADGATDAGNLVFATRPNAGVLTNRFIITSGGALSIGSPATLASSSAGTIVLANAKSLRSANAGGSDTINLIYQDANNSVCVAPDGGQRIQIGGGATNVTAANANQIVLTNSTAPGANVGGGGILYVESGAVKWRGSSGTVTTMGNAEPHCPTCGADFMHEWESERYGYLAFCVRCLAAELGDRPWILRKKQPQLAMAA